jgi:hypothetical protein
MEVFGRHLQHEVSEELKDAFRSTRKPAILDYGELGDLSDPEPRD